MSHGRRAPIVQASQPLSKTLDPPSYIPPEQEEEIEYFPKPKPRPGLCCAMISLVAVFVTIGVLGLIYSQAKTDTRIGQSQVIRETRQIGEITVETIDFRSKLEHGKQIIGIPNVALSRVVSYQVCCSGESSKSLQCQGLGSQVLSQGSDASSSKLELLLGDSRNLDSNCRIVLWLK